MSNTPYPYGKDRRTGGSNTKYLPALIIMMICFIVVGGYGVRSVEQEIKSNLADQLQLTLEANIESLRLFFKDKKLNAKVLADQPEIKKNILSLIQLTREKDMSAEELRETSSLKWLREHLGKAVKNFDFIGFVIFDSTGLQIGALLEEPLGKRQLIERSVFFYRSLQGDTVVSNPFAGEVDLPDEKGKFRNNQTTQFVSTPVKDQDGKIQGVLSFRLRPQKDFGKILAVSRFGKTGETYALNDEGLLVSNSRFDSQLREMGLISHGKASIFNIQIRNPGRDLRLAPALSNEPTKNWPLTLMAKNALMKKAGVNVEGYNDYRGVPVVGAWAWMEDQMLAVATEIDAEEAFAPLNTLLFWYLILFGSLVISALVGLFMRSRILKTNRQTLENRKRLNSLTGIIFDSIVAINEKGIIQTVNPAVEKVFGYSEKELIGENVKILIPESFVSEYDSYLKNYLRTGEKKIINMVREITGRHKNGSVFPMELSVSESTENDQKVFVGVLRNISERKAHERAIESAHRERNLILNSAGEGIYGVDLNGETTFVNPAACKMLGYTEEELIGKALLALIHHTYLDGTQYSIDKCHIYAAFKDGKEHLETGEIFWKKNGSSFPVEYMSKPITDDGKIIGAVVTFTDITTRKANEEELKLAYNDLEMRIQDRTQELSLAKEQAENHNRAKSEFLSRMSHELRTPMNAILGFAQIMNESRKDPLSDAHKSRTHQILKAGNHLLELINEVLDLARIEAGKTTVSLEPVQIAELVQEIVNVTRPMAEKFNIQLVNEISANGNAYVLADKTRLKQVLLNLVSNGIKYNRKEGRVTLSLGPLKTSNRSILVTDTGMGMPLEKIKNIFEPFDRLGVENSETEGTGIGMTISKKLVELMNGHINVESYPGKGTQFSVSLPVCNSEAIKCGENIEVLKIPFLETADENFTLLYIEDNQANMLLVQDILSDYPEIKMLTAQQAAIGLQMAHAHQPNLILLDINLPDLDGFETLKRLQNLEETYETPVIAISANAMEKDINRALEAGFNCYLTKPLDIPKFKSTVEKLLMESKIRLSKNYSN